MREGEGAAGTDIAQGCAKGEHRGISPVEFCIFLMLLGREMWLLIHQKDLGLQKGGGRARTLLSKYFKVPQGLRKAPGLSESVYQTRLILSHFIFCLALTM